MIMQVLLVHQPQHTFDSKPNQINILKKIYLYNSLYLFNSKFNLTGNVPGVAESKKDTQEFAGLPNSVLDPEKSFDFDDI